MGTGIEEESRNATARHAPYAQLQHGGQQKRISTYRECAQSTVSNWVPFRPLIRPHATGTIVRGYHLARRRLPNSAGMREKRERIRSRAGGGCASAALPLKARCPRAKRPSHVNEPRGKSVQPRVGPGNGVRRPSSRRLRNPPRSRFRFGWSRSSRWVDYDTHELLEMISELEDERRWARLREGRSAVLFHVALLSAITWIPKYVFKVPPVIDPIDAIRQRKKSGPIWITAGCTAPASAEGR